MCNLVPQLGNKPGPSYWEHGILLTGPPEKCLSLKKKKKKPPWVLYFCNLKELNSANNLTNLEDESETQMRAASADTLITVLLDPEQRTLQNMPLLLTQGDCEIINPCCFQPLRFCDKFLWSNRKPTQMPMWAWPSAGVLGQRNREGEQREACIFIYMIKGKHRTQWDQWRSLSFWFGKVENKQAAPNFSKL